MSPEQQVIGIAAALGWTDIKRDWVDHDTSNAMALFGNRPNKRKNTFFPLLDRVPDYLNSLDDCVKFEDSMDADELAEYAKLLAKHHPTYCASVLDERDPTLDFWCETASLIRCTAPQRVDAFLRVKGLFKPSA